MLEYDTYGALLLRHKKGSCMGCYFGRRSDRLLAADLLKLMGHVCWAEHDLVTRFGTIHSACSKSFANLREVFGRSKESLDCMRRGSASGVVRTAAQAKHSLLDTRLPINAVANYRHSTKALYNSISNVLAQTHRLDGRRGFEKTRFGIDVIKPIGAFMTTKKKHLSIVGKMLASVISRLSVLEAGIQEAVETATLAQILTCLSKKEFVKAERELTVLIDTIQSSLSSGGAEASVRAEAKS
jgi:hypothetical protein